MKERITYIIRNPKLGFEPSNLEVAKASISVSSLDGAKEHRITLALAEVPQELVRVLKNCHELHIRWATSREHDSIAPYVSRVTPGLHVFYTPLREKATKRLCSLIQKLFGSYLKCVSTENILINFWSAFTTPPNISGRFSHSASRQYFQPLESTDNLVAYIGQTTCSEHNYECKLRVHDLLTADYIDGDYDSISHAVNLRAYWSQSHLTDKLWWETHHIPANGSLEVGVLINETPDEEEELRYSGFLTQVGDDDKPSPTLFSFPARHHPLPQSSTFKASFRIPSGLHPTYSVQLPADSLTPPSRDCYLHSYLTLPSPLFIDKYPLSDPLFLASHNLKALHSISGATDLEAPDWVTDAWGSAVLFEIVTPPSAKESLEVTIPTHLRYLSPIDSRTAQGLRSLLIPYPSVFWACNAELGSQFSTSPFDRTNLGYDGLFGPKTVFYYFNPSGPVNGSGLANFLDVPVLDLNRTGAGMVEWGTVFVILVGTAWVCWSLMGDFVSWGKGGREKEIGNKSD
ncbi:PIG-X-domain-containing protein [Tothia fuscella]|uniref:Protein PBN1 n=1 Tax=Tothia fuscella TaxID=1048955 RepID=A0A9P4NRR9_9PEZI|nr:PIG-X-domain-containing protein [Tothia fuscella]